MEMLTCAQSKKKGMLMSITRRVLAQSPEPEVHDKVLMITVHVDGSYNIHCWYIPHK